jgi:alpha-1,2-mannosyltransferase
MRTRTQVWILLSAVVFSVATAEIFGRRYSFFDMKIYHGAVEWWTSGNELYEFAAPGSLLGFTYPPFAALVMLPMAGMSAVAAGWVNLVASVVALAAVLAALLVPIADRIGWPRWLVVAAALPLALALEPGRETIGFGQVNLLLFALVLADLVALRWQVRPPAAASRAPAWLTGAVAQALRRFWYSGAWAGVGIGLATAIKVTPGLFILYLLVSRQWRTAAVATGSAGGASLVGLVLAPRESWAYFTSVLWQTDRVGAADFTPNQSLAGILARLYDQPETPTMLWLSFAAVCCALGLSRAISAHRDGDELAAFTLVGLTAVVISPISWTHHLVFVVPAVVILADLALRRRAAAAALGQRSALTGLRYSSAAVGTYLLFLMAPIWWVHHRLPEGSHYDSGLWGVLAENSLALGVILLVAAMPWRPQRSIMILRS